MPAEGGSARQLTTGNFNHYGSLSWSPDSESIFFSAHRSDDWELASSEADIHSVKITDESIDQITDQSGEESSPIVSPNGKLVAFNLRERRPLAYTPNRIAVMDLEGKNIRVISGDLDGLSLIHI